MAGFGPYQILETLGRGGMGVVYRARHTGTGEWAALKTVLVSDTSLLVSLRREIHALTRLQHPGIVRILHQGENEGRPWYAMELLDGRTMRERLRRAGAAARAPDAATVAVETPAPDDVTAPIHARPASPARASDDWPEPLEGAELDAMLALVKRLCAPLAYMHGEGLVHRDLKPENVMVRPDGSPALVDFGLMASFGGAVARDVLSATGETAGTPWYMSPEQVRGEQVDARADLYALGCILYELLTGRPPFIGGSIEVIGQHLTRPPEPPSRRAPGMPLALEALILRLLAKEPADRLGSATRVAALLERRGVRVGPPWGPAPKPFLFRPSMVGRDTLMAALARHLAEAVRARGALVLLGGESGSGKTRLLMEVADRARTAGFATCTGASEPTDAAGPERAPLGPLRPLLQQMADRCRRLGAEETARLCGAHGRVLAAYEPALAGVPGMEAMPEPARLSPQAAQLRLYHALASAIGALAETDPLLVALDDLQWADDLTLGFLDFLASQPLFARARILVVGAYRSEDHVPRCDELASRKGVAHHAVGRLDDGAVASMMEGLLGTRAPQPFVAYVARSSEGSPFFVGGILRAALLDGTLTSDSEGGYAVAARPYDTLPLPGSLYALVQRRLDALAAPARTLLDLLAAAGTEIDEELVPPSIPTAKARGWTR